MRNDRTQLNTKKANSRSVMRITPIIWKSRCVPGDSRVPVSPRDGPETSFRIGFSSVYKHFLSNTDDQRELIPLRG